jgi:large subunit ribosomal protein L25
MAEKKLKAEKRSEGGKGPARRLRASGRVPGVLYGLGVEPIEVAVDSRELFHILHTDAGSNVLIDLDIEGDNHLAMPREIQRDLIHNRFIHIDFLAVSRTETIHVGVPVHPVGEAHGIKNEGGVMEHHLWEVQVEAFPQDVPDSFQADITELSIGDSLKVSSLVAPNGVTILTDPDETVLSIVQPQIAKALEELEEAEAEAAALAAAEAEFAGELPEGAEPEAEGEAEASEGAEGAGEEATSEDQG